MKRIISLILFIVFTGVLSSFKTGSIDPSLTGTWHYIDEYSHELKINFYENAEITIYIEGKRTNGKSECDEKHCSISYTVNTSTKPSQIDLIYTDIISKKTNEVVKGIYELISPDKIRIKFERQTGIRPEGFSDSKQDGTAILDRIKTQDKK